jgi:hypothetical protein
MKRMLQLKTATAVAVAISAVLCCGCQTTDRARTWVGVPYVLGYRTTYYPPAEREIDRVCIIGIPVYYTPDQ